jgi:predicted enzyme related to lactoylglutathione lyase
MLLRHITVDCADPYALATFWSTVTGWPVSDEDAPGDDEVLVEAPAPVPGLLFIRVPEAKSVKNRVHLDWKPTERTRDEEVARILDLGATVHEDHRRPDGRGWVTLLDPEGNEFCVERGAA